MTATPQQIVLEYLTDLKFDTGMAEAAKGLVDVLAEADWLRTPEERAQVRLWSAMQAGPAAAASDEARP